MPFITVIKGERIEPGPVVRAPIIRVPLWLAALGWTFKAAYRLVTLTIKHWRVTGPALVLWWLHNQLGGVGLALLGLGLVAVPLLVAGLMAWRRGRISGFVALTWWPIKAAWRRFWVYRRLWYAAMVGSGLAKSFDSHAYVPAMLAVRHDGYRDRVKVRMLTGQAPEHWEAQAPALAHTFGARSCQVRVAEPGRIWLDLVHADTLAETIPALEPASPERVDLSALLMGQQENGDAFRLRLAGTHVLVAGSTGAGKGSFANSLIRAVAPLVRTGQLRLHGIDPKGGMELSPSERMFTTLVYDNGPDAVQLLEDLAARMKERARGYRGKVRKWTPGLGDPFELLIVDELADVIAYQRERDLRQRANMALQTITSQGRAPGFAVVGLLQDPRKDVISFRNLFPTRIAYRLDEADQVDMVLGEGARQRGALADQIPESMPGIGFVKVDGQREPVRIRTAYPTDDDITALCAEYGRLRGVEGGAA